MSRRKRPSKRKTVGFRPQNNRRKKKEKTTTADVDEQVFNLAIQHHQRGNFQEAMSYYKKAIQINPNLSEAHNNLGYAYQGLGKTQEAMNCYQKAIQINPNL